MLWNLPMKQTEIIRIANERAEKAAALRDAGLTYKVIGQLLGGVCLERARSIVFRGYRKRRRTEALERGTMALAERAAQQQQTIKSDLVLTRFVYDFARLYPEKFEKAGTHRSSKST